MTQYQVQNNSQIRKNQKVIRNPNDELLVKSYSKKKQSNFQQPKLNHQIVLGLSLIRDGIVKIVNILIINRSVMLIKLFLDKINNFQLDYHMLIKRLVNYNIHWLKLNITQQKA